eukprot:4544312-Alexandrium_andersonii.AAC.1
MSASLVGSEMCIRDRLMPDGWVCGSSTHICRVRPLARVLSCLLTCMIALNFFAANMFARLLARSLAR